MKSWFLSPEIFVQILHIYVVFKVIDAVLYGSDVQIMHVSTTVLVIKVSPVLGVT